MQITLNTPELVLLGALLMFAAMLVVLVSLVRCEKIWQLLLMWVAVLPLAWIAGALIFSQQTTSSCENPNVEYAPLPPLPPVHLNR